MSRIVREASHRQKHQNQDNLQSANNSSQPDYGLIDQLYSFIEESPTAIEARVLLLYQWANAGHLDVAEGTAKELLLVDPTNADAQRFLHSQQSSAPRRSPQVSRPQQEPSSSRGKPVVSPARVPRNAEERASMEVELAEGYTSIRSDARTLLKEISLVHDLRSSRDDIESHADIDEQIRNLKALADGQIQKVVSKIPPRSARAVARDMESTQRQALEIGTEDLVMTVWWMRSEGDVSNDIVREALSRRIRVLEAALPETLGHIPKTALMHVEHEELGRSYVNDETMYGDPVAAIPRESFWVSEDGFAWDMGELALALSTNSGVMRNPLSREMFSVGDVRAIISHPLGKRLAALQVEQSKLSQGVRPATTDMLEQLSAALLADQSSDQLASRHAIDAFSSYIATLPPAEQNAIERLRVPATDSFTGQAFDCTIGDAVRDARANKVCLHKTGDLIGQAARYLRRNGSGSS
ncbi:hypothetical protein BDY21DRAFT_1605 [Lineolata rhizophorae]|uniref:Uncharacterized protein n=1 Tax=Lineolata rhizophorae TaxID=578093 RepID=A0A6A6PCX2_9PEZI|nr:hypothetical protein BDY21DRAFT_1605 [Lineolata rhizophorae]